MLQAACSGSLAATNSSCEFNESGCCRRKRQQRRHVQRQAREPRVYNLTVSYQPTKALSIPVRRPIGPVDASQALKEWFEAEVIGYHVTCRNETGAIVTKGELRAAVQRA